MGLGLGLGLGSGLGLRECRSSAQQDARAAGHGSRSFAARREAAVGRGPPVVGWARPRSPHHCLLQHRSEAPPHRAGRCVAVCMRRRRCRASRAWGVARAATPLPLHARSQSTAPVPHRAPRAAAAAAAARQSAAARAAADAAPRARPPRLPPPPSCLRRPTLNPLSPAVRPPSAPACPVRSAPGEGRGRLRVRAGLGLRVRLRVWA